MFSSLGNQLAPLSTDPFFPFTDIATTLLTGTYRYMVKESFVSDWFLSVY
jgi:hypothetical protein